MDASAGASRYRYNVFTCRQYVLIWIIEVIVQRLMLLLALRSVPGLSPATKTTPQPPAVSAREMELQVLLLDLAKNNLVI